MPSYISPKIANLKLFEYFLYVSIIFGIILAACANYMQRTIANSNNLIVTTAVGYIIASIGVLTLGAISISLNQKTNISGFANAFNQIIISPLPSILTVGILIYATILTLVYKSQLSKHHVADEYYTYSMTFTILILIQVGLLISNTRDQLKNIGKTSIGNEMSNSSIKYVISVFAIVCAIILAIMQTILHFFSTDG